MEECLHFDVLLEFQKIPELWKIFIVHKIFVNCVFTVAFIFSDMLTFLDFKDLYSVIKVLFHLLYIAYIRVILKVRRSGGENGQFLHNSASNA